MRTKLVVLFNLIIIALISNSAQAQTPIEHPICTSYNDNYFVNSDVEPGFDVYNPLTDGWDCYEQLTNCVLTTDRLGDLDDQGDLLTFLDLIPAKFAAKIGSKTLWFSSGLIDGVLYVHLGERVYPYFYKFLDRYIDNTTIDRLVRLGVLPSDWRVRKSIALPAYVFDIFKFYFNISDDVSRQGTDNCSVSTWIPTTVDSPTHTFDVTVDQIEYEIWVKSGLSSELNYNGQNGGISLCQKFNNEFGSAESCTHPVTYQSAFVANSWYLVKGTADLTHPGEPVFVRFNTSGPGVYFDDIKLNPIVKPTPTLTPTPTPQPTATATTVVSCQQGDYLSNAMVSSMQMNCYAGGYQWWAGTAYNTNHNCTGSNYGDWSNTSGMIRQTNLQHPYGYPDNKVTSINSNAGFPRPRNGFDIQLSSPLVFSGVNIVHGSTPPNWLGGSVKNHSRAFCYNGSTSVNCNSTNPVDRIHVINSDSGGKSVSMVDAIELVGACTDQPTPTPLPTGFYPTSTSTPSPTPTETGTPTTTPIPTVAIDCDDPANHSHPQCDIDPTPEGVTSDLCTCSQYDVADPLFPVLCRQELLLCLIERDTTDIDNNTDGLESLQATVIAELDKIEQDTTNIEGNTDQIEPLLATIIAELRKPTPTPTITPTPTTSTDFEYISELQDCVAPQNAHAFTPLVVDGRLDTSDILDFSYGSYNSYPLQSINVWASGASSYIRVYDLDDNLTDNFVVVSSDQVSPTLHSLILNRPVIAASVEIVDHPGRGEVSEIRFCYDFSTPVPTPTPTPTNEPVTDAIDIDEPIYVDPVSPDGSCIAASFEATEFSCEFEPSWSSWTSIIFSALGWALCQFVAIFGTPIFWIYDLFRMIFAYLLPYIFCNLSELFSHLWGAFTNIAKMIVDFSTIYADQSEHEEYGFTWMGCSPSTLGDVFSAFLNYRSGGTLWGRIWSISMILLTFKLFRDGIYHLSNLSWSEMPNNVPGVDLSKRSD